MRVSPRFVSLFFFVATLAISVWAVSKYRDLQRSVSDQREEIAGHAREMAQKAAFIAGQRDQISDNEARLGVLRTENSEATATISRQRDQISANENRLASLQAENNERAVTIVRQREQISANEARLAVLQAQNDERAATIDLQSGQISANAQQLEASEARLAAMESANNFMEGGSYGISDLGNSFSDLCSRNSGRNDIASFCAGHRSNIDLMRLLTTALRARISAPNSHRYEDMRASYGAIIQFLDDHPGSPWNAGWRALAAEGVAYAEMKLGRLSEASATIARAAELNPYDGGTGVTSIKIMCEQGRPVADVQRDFSALTRRLDERIAATRPGNLEGRNARLEREIFLRDAELYRLCGDAHLEQISAPSTPR